MTRKRAPHSRAPRATSRFLGAAAAIFALATPLGARAEKPAPAPPPPPPAAARLWVIAPSATGSWTLRIDNEGDVALRVPADVRLLRLELEPLPDAKNKHPQKVRCEAPGALRPDGFPDDRALLLAPGQSYVESFDPRLLCFGKKAAALAGGTIVRARFGWDPPSKYSKKPPSPPFAAQSTDAPPSSSPLNELHAPTMLLSYDTPEAVAKATEPQETAAKPADKAADQAKTSTTKPEAVAPAEKGAVSGEPPADKGAAPGEQPAAAPADKGAAPGEQPAAAPAAADKAPAAPADRPETAAADKPPAIKDAAAPRLELTTEPMSDAGAPRSAAIQITATNAGLRSTKAALRSRMFSFRIKGPDGVATCDASPPTHAIPRDNYQTIKAGGSVSFNVLLAERCPVGTLARPGLYEVTPTLQAGESGEEAGITAYTGTAEAPRPTLLRLQSAPGPYYKNAPRAVSTASLTPKPEE